MALHLQDAENEAALLARGAGHLSKSGGGGGGHCLKLPYTGPRRREGPPSAGGHGRHGGRAPGAHAPGGPAGPRRRSGGGGGAAAGAVGGGVGRAAGGVGPAAGPRHRLQAVSPRRTARPSTDSPLIHAHYACRGSSSWRVERGASLDHQQIALRTADRRQRLACAGRAVRTPRATGCHRPFSLGPRSSGEEVAPPPNRAQGRPPPPLPAAVSLGLVPWAGLGRPRLSRPMFSRLRHKRCLPPCLPPALAASSRCPTASPTPSPWPATRTPTP